MADDLDEYLSTLLAREAPKVKLLRGVEEASHLALLHTKAKVIRGEVGVPGVSIDVGVKIPYLQERHTSEYEEQIREHRLKEALRVKKELEEKLSFISDTINVLNAKAEPDATKPKPPKVPDKETRKHMHDLEEAKRKESLEFAKRQMEIQRDRQRRRQLQVQQMAESLSQHIEHDRQQRSDIEQRLREEKEKRMLMLKQQAEARQEEIMLARQRLRVKNHNSSDKPAVGMPELEQRRMELAKKRLPAAALQDQLYRPKQPGRLMPEKLIDENKRPLPVVVEEEKHQPTDRRARMDKKLGDLLAKQGEKAEKGARNSRSSGKPRNPLEPSHRVVNSSMSEGELAATKPPRSKPQPKPEPPPHSKPKGDEDRNERMQEALERFKSSKMSFASEEAGAPLGNSQQPMRKQDFSATMFHHTDGDGVITSIREKLSLLKS